MVSMSSLPPTPAPMGQGPMPQMRPPMPQGGPPQGGAPQGMPQQGAPQQGAPQQGPNPQMVQQLMAAHQAQQAQLAQQAQQQQTQAKTVQADQLTDHMRAFLNAAHGGAQAAVGKDKMTPQELAAMGRFGDTHLTHTTPGEIIVPTSVQSPQVLSVLQNAFLDKGISPSSAVVGGQKEFHNPKTGLPEHFDLGSMLPVLAPIVLAATGGMAAPGLAAAAGLGNTALGGLAGSALMSGVGSGVGTAITGGTAKQALLGGLGSAAGAGLGGAIGGGGGVVNPDSAALTPATPSPASPIGTIPGSTGPFSPATVSEAASQGGGLTGASADHAFMSQIGANAAGSAGSAISPTGAAAINTSMNAFSPGMMQNLSNMVGSPLWSSGMGQTLGGGIGSMLGNSLGSSATSGVNTGPTGPNLPSLASLGNVQTLLGQNQTKGQVPNFQNYNPLQAGTAGGYNFYPIASS